MLFKNCLIYSSFIYLGGSIGNNAINLFLYNIYTDYHDIYFSYRDRFNHLKYNLLGIFSGSLTGFILARSFINNNYFLLKN